MKKSEAIQSFWSKVEIRGLDECWPWRGHVSRYGYGTYNGLYDHLGTNRCHRQAYILVRGGVAHELHILHSCDNRSCCNPLHLRSGTHSENMRDMTDRNRQSHHGVSQPGERNGCHRLTETEVRAILQDERTLREISQDYGVSKARISQIKLRKSWRHVR